MKSKFHYDDIVSISSISAAVDRRRQLAWVMGIFTTRPFGPYFEKFQPGIVYSVEFEEGTSIEIHEDELLAAITSNNLDGDS